jgi:hypothetical protein
MGADTNSITEDLPFSSTGNPACAASNLPASRAMLGSQRALVLGSMGTACRAPARATEPSAALIEVR